MKRSHWVLLVGLVVVLVVPSVVSQPLLPPGLVDMVVGEPTTEQDIIVHLRQERNQTAVFASVTNATQFPIGPQEGTSVEYTVFTTKHGGERYLYWNGSAFTNETSWRNMTVVPGTQSSVWKVSPDPPSVGNYTFLVRAQTNESGAVMGVAQEWVTNFEQFKQGDKDVDPEGGPVSVLSIDPLTGSQVFYLILLFSILLLSAYHGWFAPAIVTLMAIPEPLFAANGVDYPIDITAWAFFLALGIVLQMAVAKFQSLRGDPGGV